MSTAAMSKSGTIWKRKRQSPVAVLAVLCLLFQALFGALHGGGNPVEAAGQDASPFAYMVICTPDGIIRLGPDGQPYEGEEKRPQSSGPCHACGALGSCGILAPEGAEIGRADLAKRQPLALAKAAPHPSSLSLLQRSRAPPNLV